LLGSYKTNPLKNKSKKLYLASIPHIMYINSFCTIGINGIFTSQDQSSAMMPTTTIASNTMQEPDYTAVIPPMQLRRMTKPVRTGIAAARQCLDLVASNVPASIHVGTAFGMLQDSEVFLSKMITQEEQMLNPTAFIQSTHNTVAGAIALSLQCNTHNMTFVHHAHSLESAYWDANLMPTAVDMPNLLWGGLDELTPTSLSVLKHFNNYSYDQPAGEGTTFFSLSHQQQQYSLAYIDQVRMHYQYNLEELKKDIESTCSHSTEPCIWITGLQDTLLSDVLPDSYKPSSIIPYRKYSGTYPTDTAYAVALATLYIKEGAKSCCIITQSGKEYSYYVIKAIA
jgi:3-oxoacyl-[acyl-carrier-protein] synthase II